MAKLNIYIGNADKPTTIDSDHYALGKEWVVGRRPVHGDRTGIYFSGRNANLVSTRHALLRFTSYPDGGGEIIETWEICHVGRTNPTFYGSMGFNSALTPHDWQPIQDGDRFIFAHPDNTLIFRLFSEDTTEILKEDEEDPPTADLAPTPAPALPPATPRPWYAELIVLVLNGPKDLWNSIWWAFLAILAASIVLLIYR